VETRGWLPAIFEVCLHTPALLERLAAVGETLRFDSGLDPELRELATLAVARDSGCDYEWKHHLRAAKSLGVDEAMLEQLATGELSTEASPRRASVRYARLAAAGEPMDDATFEAVRDHLGDDGVVELTILAGYYLLLARLAAALHVELEPQFEVDTTGGGHETTSRRGRG
jgi:4-carboxymuconolactone decarboxylase